MFFEFGIKDIIDILLVALMLYYIYRLMRDSRSLNVFIGILVFVVTWIFVSQVLEMRLLGTILDKLVSVGVIALIVLFQDDIRKVLYNLGAHQRMRRLANLFTSKKSRERKKEGVKQDIMPVVMACMNLSRNKVGALIVFERNMPLDDIVSTGDRIDASINQRLVENIFFKNSPLHDGAMIISQHRIKAAGCILPVSHDLDIPKELGLRHRSAMGVSQESDALAIVVSEETGAISIAFHGEFRLRLSAEELESWMLCVIPASTRAKNEARYRHFCESVSRICGIQNGYKEIIILFDRTNSKERKTDDTTGNLQFGNGFEGKRVLLFDDIVTRGVSFVQCAEKIMDKGAESVTGLFLGRTLR